MIDAKETPSKYFLLVSALFWAAVNAIYAFVRLRAEDAPVGTYEWFNLFITNTPWFALWFVITPVTFIVNGLISRLLVSRVNKILAHTVFMLTVLFAYWTLSIFIYVLVQGLGLGQFKHFWIQQITSTFQIDLIIYLGVLGLCRGLYFYDKAVSEKLELQNLQSELVDEKLKALRAQLNPHFLFNALNTIASLVRLKHEKEAVKALSSLSQMLRTILDNKNNQDVKIKDEIAFVESYLTIQKMRFEEKLETSIEVEKDCLELEIPNMLLHPLVENAIQHGSQSEAKKNPLQLKISRKNSMLHIRLVNAVATDNCHQGYGIGVSNTRERLERLYDAFDFELRQLENRMFETRVAIPLGDTNA